MSLRKIMKKVRGQAKTEYIIIALLVGIAAIAVVGLYGDNIRDLFASSSNALAGEDAVPDTAVATADVYQHRPLGKLGGAASGSPGSGAAGSGSSGSGGGGGGLGQGQNALTSGGGGSGGGSGGVSGSGKLGGKEFAGKEFGDEKGKKGDDGADVFAGASKDLFNASTEALKIGGDNANLRVGAADASGSVQAGYHDGNFEAGANLSASVAALKGTASGTLGDENGAFAKGEAEGAVLSANASIDATLAAGKDGVAAEVSGGVDANLAEGKLSASGGFRVPSFIPFIGGSQVTVGGGVSGQVGASAKGHVGGKANKEGVSFGMGGKAALGLGAGFNFNIGIKFG